MNRYARPRSATGALALGAALLVAPLGLAQDDAEEDVYELSPFTVEGAENQGYRAASTLAGTRIRTDLKDVGSAISVVTDEFLRDTSATDNESLLVYTTGTEVSGVGGNFAGGGDFGRIDSDAQRLRPNASTRVRGLAAADNTRDFFQTDIPWDSYNVDRIDLQRGPNSVLFGLGSPAGVINATTNSAIFEDGGEAEIRFGSYGTWRASVDYNKVLVEDQLAVRVAALNEEQKFMQDGAFEEDKRYYVALKWDPKFMASEGSSTSFRLNYENGDIDANRPRVIPPIDRITPWFNSMSKATYNLDEVNAAENDASSPLFSPWVNTAVGRIFDGPVAVYNSPTTGSPSAYFLAGGDQQTRAYRGIGAYDSYSKKVVVNGVKGLPGSSITAWKPATISDPTIFDFYNELIDGPNKSEWQKWDAYNISASHTMLENKLGFELVYDVQEYEDGQTNVLDNWGQSISVDIMEVLPNGTAEGAPNPNVGRPYVGGDAQNNFVNFRDRETIRGTVFYDLDFRDSKNDAVADILGHHVFTGVYSRQAYDQRTAAWIRSASQTFQSGSSITQANRYIANLAYLGPSLTGASSASGANIDRLHAELIPTNGTFKANPGSTYADAQGNVTNNVWSDPAGDRSKLYRSGNLSRNETDSLAFVWQGYLFKGNVVPVFGYREDTDEAANAGNVPAHPDGIPGAANPFSSAWEVPGGPSEVNLATNKTFVKASGINRTFSLVVHTPQEWREQMNGWGLSLTYSKSKNFRPDAGRRDLVGNPIAPTTGDTEEYGFVISGLEDRFNLKVNHYQTTVTNDTLSASSISNSYMIGAGEGWGNLFAKMTEGGVGSMTDNYALANPSLALGAMWDHDADPNTADVANAYTAEAQQAGLTVVRYQPRTDQTLQDAYNEQQAVIAAYNNQSLWPSQQFIDYWRQDWTKITPTAGWDAGGAAWNGEPSQFAITGTTRSEGWEYELFFQPTDNWNIAVNAAQTEASRFDLAKSYVDWVEARWKVINETAWGDSRLWGPSATTETVRSKYGSEFYSSYQLFKQLEGSNVAELRPWRYNLVTNYNFSDGSLAGLSVGGAWRWQDEVVTGYPVIIESDAGTPNDRTDDIARFDIDNPYKGGSESNIDLWAAYERQLSDKIGWRIQLNLRNAFEDEHLIAVTSQPDGSVATARIAEGQSWTISNTFTF